MFGTKQQTKLETSWCTLQSIQQPKRNISKTAETARKSMVILLANIETHYAELLSDQL